MLRFLNRRRRDDRGATLIFTAVFAGVAVLISGLAVDLGVQRVSRRDMQAIADLVALDLARDINGGLPTSYVGSAPLNAAMVASIKRNTETAAADPVCSQITSSYVEWSCITTETDSVGAPPTLKVSLGTLNSDGDFLALQRTSPETVTAVQVTSQSTVAFHFVPGNGPVGRKAVGVQESNACFLLGSYAAGITSAESALLNPLIGDALGIGVLGYTGLATAHVTLGDLAVELGFGSVNELLDADISLADFVLASATLLQGQGASQAGNIGLLHQMISAGVDSVHFSLGDMIDVDSAAGSSALEANLNVLDVISGAAFVANGGHFLSIPGLTANALGVSTLTVSDFHIIDGIHRACGKEGKATAETSQVNLDLKTNFPGTSPLLTGGLSAVNIVKGDVNLHLDLASAKGVLADTICGTPSVADPDKVTVDVETGVTSTSLSTSLQLSGTYGLNSLGLVNTVLNPLLNALGLLGQSVANLLSAAPTIEFNLNATASTSVGGLGTAVPATVDITNPATDDDDLTGPVSTGSPNVLSGLGSSSVALSGTVRLTSGGVRVLGIWLVPPSTVTLDVNAPAVQQLITLLNNTLNTTVSAAINPLVTSLNNLIVGPIANLVGLRVAGADVFAQGRPRCDAPTLRG